MPVRTLVITLGVILVSVPVFILIQKIGTMPAKGHLIYDPDEMLPDDPRIPAYDSFKSINILYAGRDNGSGKSTPGIRSYTKKVLNDTGGAVKTMASDFKYIYASPARINKRYAPIPIEFGHLFRSFRPPC